MVFSTVTELIYIPTNSAQWVGLLYILGNTCYLLAEKKGRASMALVLAMTFDYDTKSTTNKSKNKWDHIKLHS